MELRARNVPCYDRLGCGTPSCKGVGEGLAVSRSLPHRWIICVVYKTIQLHKAEETFDQ